MLVTAFDFSNPDRRANIQVKAPSLPARDKPQNNFILLALGQCCNIMARNFVSTVWRAMLYKRFCAQCCSNIFAVLQLVLSQLLDLGVVPIINENDAGLPQTIKLKT